MKTIISAFILFVFFSLSTSELAAQTKTNVDSVKTTKNLVQDTTKKKLITAYNKYIRFQSTAEYKKILGMNDGQVQERLITHIVDSIAKSSGLKGSKEFFEAESVYAHDPLVKRLSKRMIDNTNKILHPEEFAKQEVKLDSNQIKIRTEKLISYYEKLAKWTDSKEFKALDTLKTSVELNQAINNYANQTLKTIGLDRREIRLYESQYKLKDDKLKTYKTKFNNAVSALKSKFKDEPKPDKIQKLDRRNNKKTEEKPK